MYAEAANWTSSTDSWQGYKTTPRNPLIKIIDIIISTCNWEDWNPEDFEVISSWLCGWYMTAQGKSVPVRWKNSAAFPLRKYIGQRLDAEKGGRQAAEDRWRADELAVATKVEKCEAREIYHLEGLPPKGSQWPELNSSKTRSHELLLVPQCGWEARTLGLQPSLLS